MKHLILSGVLLMLLIGATSSAPPPAKFKYSSDEAKLSATFPAEYTTQEVPKENYRSVKTQTISDEMVFLVIYSIHDLDLSGEVDHAQVSFEAFMEGMNASPSNKMPWQVKKNNGLKATFESDQGVIGEYRVVIIGQIQYQITAVAEKDKWDENKAKKFFKSFKVKK